MESIFSVASRCTNRTRRLRDPSGAAVRKKCVGLSQAHGANDVEAVPQLAMPRHPIGRLSVPDDIARGIVFLASDDAGFMTGAGLVVDGGSTAQ